MVCYFVLDDGLLSIDRRQLHNSTHCGAAQASAASTVTLRNLNHKYVTTCQYCRSGLPLTRVVTMITASRSRTANIAQHEEIKPLNLLARPRRFAQKFEARCDAWIVAETAHRNALSQLGPSEMFDQCLEDRFKRQPMQWIAALGRRRGSRCGSVHRLILSSNAESTLLRIEGIQRR